MCIESSQPLYIHRSIPLNKIECSSLSKYGWSPDGRRRALQSAHKGDIIAGAGWDEAKAFGVLHSPPFPIALILSKSIRADYTPLLHCSIIPLQQQANLSLQLGSRLLSPAVLFSPSPTLQWQVPVGGLPRHLGYSSTSPLPAPAAFNLITGLLQSFRGGQSQEDNSRASGFTNTLGRLI